MSRSAPLIVFDLDGTLAETAGDLVATLNHILTREGMNVVSEADARRMVGTGARQLIKLGFEKSGASIAGSKPCSGTFSTTTKRMWRSTPSCFPA